MRLVSQKQVNEYVLIFCHALLHFHLNIFKEINYNSNYSLTLNTKYIRLKRL